MYGDLKPKTSEVDSNSFINNKDSLYLVPNSTVYSSPSFGYPSDVHSVNQRINYETSNLFTSSITQPKKYGTYEKEYR